MHALLSLANKNPLQVLRSTTISVDVPFPMDFNTWWDSGTKNFKSSMNYVKNGYERVVSIDIMVTGSKVSRWRMLWRKLKKEKKKFFNRTTSLEHVPSYDSYTYLQNFDQGSMWTDPDNHCRSFSARFAVPSRILQKRELVGWWEIWGRKMVGLSFFFFFNNNMYI